MGNIATPLRYPGGKTKLYPSILKIIESNNLNGCVYIEPFAGGAGIAIKLLLDGHVNKIVINDYDYALYCIWDTIVNNSDNMCSFIEKAELNVSEWQRQREIFNNQSVYDSIQIGMAAFYLNRTNVSGVLKGGVIGGLAQEGKYKIDARFNREDLINKIKAIAKRKDDIDVYNWNGKDFICDIISNYENCFVYLDPPYVKKGKYLYKNAFSEQDHIDLANAVFTISQNWIVTYDDCDLIRNTYEGFRAGVIKINYSAGPTKQGDEIIIYSPNLIIPNETV